MARRRMISLDIFDHDSFIDMPLSAQALYTHLNIRADDDGFITPKRVMRMIGCQDDDLKILIAKRFVLAFDSGVVVIKHWQTNNLIRADRYTPTKHSEEKTTLGLNGNGDYTERTKAKHMLTDGSRPLVNHLATKRQPAVNTGKVRLGKGNTPKPPTGGCDVPEHLNEAIKEFKAHRVALKSKMTDHAVIRLIGRLETLAPGDNHKQIEIINQSIDRGWKGVFPLDQQADDDRIF